MAATEGGRTQGGRFEAAQAEGARTEGERTEADRLAAEHRRLVGEAEGPKLQVRFEVGVWLRAVLDSSFFECECVLDSCIKL